MTEADMPPPQRPGPRRQEGEQDHLREGAGMTQEGLASGQKPPEHLQENAGESEREDDKGLLDRAKDKLTGR